MNFAEANEKLAALRATLDEAGSLTESAVESAFQHEIRPWLAGELQKAMKGMHAKVQAMGKGKWPTSAMEHGVTRYRPNKMTPDDFMDELSDHAEAWLSNVLHSAKTEGVETEGGSLEESTSGWLKGPLNYIFLAKRDLDALKGSFYYRLRGQGSMRDVGERPPGARQPTEPFFSPADRRKVETVEKEIKAFENEIEDLLKKGHALETKIKGIDKIMGLQ